MNETADAPIFLHPLSLVDASAQLAPGVRVGPFALVEAGAVVGAGCELRAHAVVKRFTRLGPDNVVHEGAVRMTFPPLTDAAQMAAGLGLLLDP